MSPGRPNAHPGRTPAPTPDPFAPPYPKKRHSPAPPVPTPAPSNLSHAPPIPTTAPFLPTNPPQSRNFANPLETPAHPCYPRPREGPTPRPGNPYPHTGKAPGIVGTSKTGHRPPATDPPPVLLCHAAPLLCHNNWRPALQIGAGPATPSATSRTECRRN